MNVVGLNMGDVDMSEDITMEPDGRIVSAVFGDITADVGEALRAMGSGAEITGAMQEQAARDVHALAAANKVVGPARKLRHGRRIARIPEAVYNYWQARLPGCWGQKEFVRGYMLKHFPELAVQEAANPVVRV